MDRHVLLHQMTERFQELYYEALDVLGHAPDGQWIAAGERAFHDVFQKLMKESYQAAMQSKVDGHPTAQAPAFPPANRAVADHAPLRHKGDLPVRALTIGGEIGVRRRSLLAKIGLPNESDRSSRKPPVAHLLGKTKSRLMPISLATPMPLQTARIP